MTIKKSTTLLNVFIVFAIVATLGAFNSLNDATHRLISVQRERNILLALGDELRQSSRDLTTYVRLYAVTGDSKFETEYQGVLDRRSGKTPRDTQSKFFPGERHVLLDLIRRYGTTAEEMRHITEGERLSSALVPLEVEAMHLVKGEYKDAQGQFTQKGAPDREKAAQLVHGPAYQASAAAIMAELDLFAKKLDARTEKAVEFERGEVDFARNVTLGCMAAILLTACFSAWFSRRHITTPLSETTAFALRVGEGDLAGSIAVTSNNEIGTLRKTLNQMAANIRARMGEIEAALRQTAEKEQEARAAMTAASAAESEASAKAVHLQAAACKLEELGKVVSTEMAALLRQINTCEHGAEEQAARVGSTATAMEEMNATVMDVARNAGDAAQSSELVRARAIEGATVVQKVITTIDAVHEHSQTLKTDMEDLSRHAQDINQIMGVISDIADQTNLLALNAAIEAARAGEAGRGFAVVADEVRKLAEKTMQSTGDVASAIKAIQASASKSSEQVSVTVRDIEQVTSFAGQSGVMLQEIVQLAEGSADQVRGIATASEQQSATSEEIARSISDVDAIAGETRTAMKEARGSVDVLARQAQMLGGLIVEMKKV